MNRTLPRCWIVHDVKTMSELKRPLRTPAIEERTREVLFPEAKPRGFARQAVIETDRPFPASIESTASGQALNSVDEQCRVKHHSPQYVVVEANLQQPGLLVLADAYDPGWTATVKLDGNARATPIYRTNRVLRGVWLKAGKQLIEFRYQPRSFFAGAMVSVLSWLALIVFGLNRLIRRPKLAAR
jgi:uncharacterized membrane protein YfhO